MRLHPGVEHLDWSGRSGKKWPSWEYIHIPDSSQSILETCYYYKVLLAGFVCLRIAKMSSSNTSNYDYDSDPVLDEIKKQNDYVNTLRMLYIFGYLIICTLGLLLNLIAIIAGSCYCKSDTAKWVVALAVTHLICSAFLPLQILYSWYHFNWHYGTALCKLSSYVLYASMFSTAGMLTLHSVSDGIQCTPFRHSSGVLIMILCSWIFALILSIPSLFFRELQYTTLGEECDDGYVSGDKTTPIIIVCYRFLLGFLIPSFLISICCCCQSKRNERNMKQIMCLIKLAYFVCWTPLLFIGLLQAKSEIVLDFPYRNPIATVLAVAHCCVNPVVYLLVSNDFKMQWMKQAQSDKEDY
ncbi:chemerin-like receptor 1 isoform X2 [Hemibagrus wyckioides]|uniref:chemerin-like receptor 1 isoform X2 n=1 Tax=Hemibagrus wyckioides TaxID=337641 RepID=UPI00266C40E1|nr:chemerin-like receptor 1 isoform X2 [Hemibagrus wyckioides]